MGSYFSTKSKNIKHYIHSYNMGRKMVTCSLEKESLQAQCKYYDSTIYPERYAPFIINLNHKKDLQELFNRTHNFFSKKTEMFILKEEKSRWIMESDRKKLDCIWDANNDKYVCKLYPCTGKNYNHDLFNLRVGRRNNGKN